MRSLSRSYQIAAIGALVHLAGLGVVIYVMRSVSLDSPGDSFAAGLFAGFVLVAGLFSLLGLAEAALLAIHEVVVPLATWPRRFLQGGVVFGVLSSLAIAFSMGLTHFTADWANGNPLALRITSVLFGAWILLAAAGVLCSLLGVVANAAVAVHARL
ncbi:hypothetical protein [Halomicrobium salinisoli]|uniref:hypothetical protein n=1 Tax=Halomicrobium salinisoli TaxID=2878391 RepID=UPI001CEFFEBF|nr:hypothetical protein [Halomicrobium salinisoli]